MSFHDALYARRALGLQPAPELKAWLQAMQIVTDGKTFKFNGDVPSAFSDASLRVSWFLSQSHEQAMKPA